MRVTFHDTNNTPLYETSTLLDLPRAGEQLTLNTSSPRTYNVSAPRWDISPAGQVHVRILLTPIT